MPIRPHAGAGAPPDWRSMDVSDLLWRWHNQADWRARDALVERFLPLARKLAGRYSSSPEPFEDLVQVATVGLIAAIDRFDPARGCAFPSFAVPTILGEIKRHFRNSGWSVHVPRGAKELALRVENGVRDLETQLGDHPSIQELGQYLELPVEQVIAGLDAGAGHYALSLDAPVTTRGDDPGQALLDMTGAVDDGYGLVETRLSLAVAIQQLPAAERDALGWRLGHDMKQTDIAKALGCSQMQVSRLLRRAAARVRGMTDPEVVVH